MNQIPDMKCCPDCLVRCRCLEPHKDGHGPSCLNKRCVCHMLQNSTPEYIKDFREHFIPQPHGVFKDGQITHPQYIPLTLKNVELFLTKIHNSALEEGRNMAVNYLNKNLKWKRAGDTISITPQHIAEVLESARTKQI